MTTAVSPDPIPTPPGAPTAPTSPAALGSLAFPLDERTLAVAEPHVKAALAARGVRVPAGVTGRDPDELAAAVTAAGLDGPLAVKAYGPGLLHKSDVGAVALGVDRDDVAAAGGAMSSRLADQGFGPHGYLAEEMVAGGVELIVGVVRRPPFGPVVALGLGGTLTEVLDQVALRLLPLTEADAVQLVRTSPVAPFLSGVRGQPPVDEEALVALLVAVAGPDGLVAELGDGFAELDLNPVLASADGAVALDARLVLRAAVEAFPPPRPAAPSTDFTRLFRPRSVAVAGASTRGAGFGSRALAAYRSMGWTDGLYAIHPTADEVGGVPARPSVADLHDLVDYLLVTVPAERCAEVVRSTGGRVPFVHVVSGGFGEAGPDGAQLGDDLVAAGREVGARIIGPNCIGIYSPAGRQAFQLGDPLDEGTVSIVSQSGGLAGDIIKAGAGRGLRFSKVATVGNAIDVTPGELAGWLVDDPETAALGIYLEGSDDAARLVDALRHASGRVPVALLLGGQSRQGAAAVASHTGSLAGDRRIWSAVADATGTALVTTLEDLLAVLTYVQRWGETRVAEDPRVLVVGVGGGASVLATDACDRAGLDVAPIDADLQDELRDMGYGVGTSVANPLEIPFGPVAPVDALRRALDPVQSRRPYADVVVHVNVQAYYSYGTEGVVPLVAQLEDLSTALWPGCRLALVVRNLECAPGADAGRLRAETAELGLPLFRDFDEAATAIAAMKRFTRARLTSETRSGGWIAPPGGQSSHQNRTASGRAALRCSEQRRAAGGSAVGSTPSSGGLLLVEVPLPWSADVATMSQLAPLVEVAAGHRVQAVVPQGDLPPDEVRVVRYRRPAGPFDRYRRQERVVPARDLVAGVAALVQAPTPAGAADTGGAADLVDVLVCTHGSRDTCCGRAGVRLFQELQGMALPGVRVWRTSHLGGHRFAPTAMTLPDGRAWAWLDGPTLAGIVRRDIRVEVVAGHDRGCAGFDDPWAQAADHAVLIREGWGWLDRARHVSVMAPAGSAVARRRIRVTGEPGGVGGAPGTVAYEVVVEVARTLPVPVCGQPLDAAVKSEQELRVVSVEPVAPEATEAQEAHRP